MTQAALNQANQSRVEHDDSHSALFYLFQEVSKLASPNHNIFLDTGPPSTLPNEAAKKDSLVIEMKEEHMQSFQISNDSCLYRLPYNQVNKVKAESPESKDTSWGEPQFECSSPWKVLSLINLHCEQLLHKRDVEKLDPTSVFTATNLDHSATKSLTAAPDVSSRSDGFECTSRLPFCPCERQEIPNSVSPEKDDCKLCCEVNSEVDFSVQLQTGEKTHIVENAMSQPCIPNACVNTQLTFNSNDKDCVALSEPVLTLDHNANFILSAESPCDTQLHPLVSIPPPSHSTSFISSVNESCPLISSQDDKTTPSKPQCTHRPIEEKSPKSALAAHLKSCAASKPVQKDQLGQASTYQRRTKTSRKQPHPSRSADIQDPDFQGVTFRIDTELDDSREQCRLLITSKYSKELCKSVRKQRVRMRTSQKSLKTSSSDEEDDQTANVLKDKVCASCSTRKTPMWRDAEDGTPLCNACGIRYKKYRVRCVNCWHIPRKEDNSNSCCLKCGKFVRMTSAQRKLTT
ncbi:GATA-type zinc finger protein 1 [Mugil cephalus]|uniref:GATA-type zinc finger protein 1 n=1 Tax=Mugil cephalus TaxID=48193 RepID=UPI001FB80FDA|nr:GATA-type zinc finger protein 1 [Mugil cephalus]XP_047435497.1 GATA-type zinc finger protein 1 [Mugil cephalus]